MATKPYVTVSLLLHGAPQPITIEDYVDEDSGRFINIGTQAAAAIARREQIHYVGEDGNEMIIPFHAIVSADITKESDEYTYPEDDFCQSLCPEAGCNVSYTVSFYNDDELLQEEVLKVGATPEYSGVTPSKEGYTFLGWNTDKDAQTALESLPAVSDTAAYYAIFEAE